MYNPFPLLTQGLLQDELSKGKRWIVRQTFQRGMETTLKAAFLLRAYLPEEKELAEEHLAALEKDKHAFLYDTSLTEHIEKLKIAAQQPNGYKIYYAAKKGTDWDPPENYKQKMRHYIRTNHPAWSPQEKGKKIEIGLYEEFGQLFLKFSYDKEHHTIPFDRIEKY